MSCKFDPLLLKIYFSLFWWLILSSTFRCYGGISEMLLLLLLLYRNAIFGVDVLYWLLEIKYFCQKVMNQDLWVSILQLFLWFFLWCFEILDDGFDLFRRIMVSCNFLCSHEKFRIVHFLLFADSLLEDIQTDFRFYFVIWQHNFFDEKQKRLQTQNGIFILGIAEQSISIGDQVLLTVIQKQLQQFFIHSKQRLRLIEFQIIQQIQVPVFLLLDGYLIYRRFMPLLKSRNRLIGGHIILCVFENGHFVDVYSIFLGNDFLQRRFISPGQIEILLRYWFVTLYFHDRIIFAVHWYLIWIFNWFIVQSCWRFFSLLMLLSQ